MFWFVAEQQKHNTEHTHQSTSRVKTSNIGTALAVVCSKNNYLNTSRPSVFEGEFGNFSPLIIGQNFDVQDIFDLFTLNFLLFWDLSQITICTLQIFESFLFIYFLLKSSSFQLLGRCPLQEF